MNELCGIRSDEVVCVASGLGSEWIHGYSPSSPKDRNEFSAAGSMVEHNAAVLSLCVQVQHSLDLPRPVGHVADKHCFLFC